jgi:hypothetical protein
VTPDEFFGRDGERTFAFGAHLHGAFGGVFGGVLAAATVVVARELAPGRVPASLDCRFLRALPAGRAHVVADALHAGRSMTTVTVDLVDDRARTTTHATITLVEPAALSPLARDEPGHEWSSGDGTPWRNPPGVHAPIIETLAPRTVPIDGDAIATAVDAPWTVDDRCAGAEAVCIAADLCVGPPVALACRGRRVAHPNPDLSLRFAGGTAIPPETPVVAAGRLASLGGGVATVAIDVVAGGRLAGVGTSFSVLLEAASG